MCSPGFTEKVKAKLNKSHMFMYSLLWTDTPAQVINDTWMRLSDTTDKPVADIVKMSKWRSFTVYVLVSGCILQRQGW